ncbi:MAG: glycosyltransferase [Ferruginibacter sp.]|nr:glycosyltransferase [Ferruginibacter sp.]
MNINILSNKISWFGKYSGYECLTDYFPKNGRLVITKPNDLVFNKLVGKIFRTYKGWEDISPTDIYAELNFFRRAGLNNISHILYLESHVHALKMVKNNRHKLVGTIHLPISQWTEERLEMLADLDNAIILYDEEIAEFSKYINREKIQVIKHGVDIDFFKPGDISAVKKNKILFVGHYLRNFHMFMEVYDIVRKDIGDVIEFHFIIPSFGRDKEIIQKITTLKNVFFHEGLSDEALLDFYQTSYLLLMPMTDSGANTAIVQALGAGLPIVTTDVGGIRSYGGGEVFPVVTNNSGLEMAELFAKYYYDNDFRNSIAEKQRQFAMEKLDWNLIARQHISCYESILSSGK